MARPPAAFCRFPLIAQPLAILFRLVLCLGLPVLCASAADQNPNSGCLECHGDQTLDKTNAAGKVISLYVDQAKLTASVHTSNACVNCHIDITAQHPDDNVPAKVANCIGCHNPQPSHEEAARQYATSIHGASRTMGASGAASCGDCHGSHAMLPVTNAASPVFKMNLPETCAKCHSNPGLTKAYEIRNPQAASQYLDSIHGRGLIKMGLIVAPSCNDCHGVHDIKPSVYPTSPINRTNIARTCGKCHLGIERTYDQSIHGQLLAKGDPRGPVCTDCHTAHQIENPEGNNFKAISDQRCGKCHQDRLAHYRETYHGKAMALGRPNVAPEVAACYDCHGYHDILPNSNPRSHLSKANIVGTCRKCHSRANASFTEYDPHADPLDRDHSPALHWTFVLMTSLLIGVFAFFGAHTLLWLVRSAYLYLHDSKTFRELKISAQEGDEWFTRFTPYERFLHVLVVTSFLLLVITGMPLKFYYTDWAKVLFHVLGGPEVARTLHHFGAIVTFLYFGLHVAGMSGRFWQRRAEFRNPATGRYSFKRLWDFWLGPDSMIPTLQDLREFVAHQKWFFGRGPKPEFDRWTYWEKFDYFAVFWGVFIIGFSGLILWFPQFFCRFMPGWVINIAMVVHSDEALLAAGFIFTVHFFNTHFRLEKFPMDTVIFSGRVSKTEMLHERKRWYQRLLSSGRIEQFRIRDEWERWKGIARSFGYFFFGLGVVLLLLILYAMITRLTH
jgi:cytochrome b subunit of formate dehydrogenase